MSSMGPAAEPKGLLDLPNEILAQILKELFSKYDFFCTGAKSGSSDSEPVHKSVLMEARVVYPRYTLQHADLVEGQIAIRQPRLTAGTLSILRSSEFFHQLGTTVLYGMYNFHGTRHSMRNDFLAQVGIFNLRLIRNMTLSFDYSMMTNLTQSIPCELEFLRKIPLLSRLVLAFGKDSGPDLTTAETKAISRHRGLLWTSAWITSRSAILKYATWNEFNTIRDNQFRFDEAALLQVVISARPPSNACSLADPFLDCLQNKELREAKEEIEALLQHKAEEMQQYDDVLSEYTRYLMRKDLHELAPLPDHDAAPTGWLAESDPYWDAEGELIEFPAPAWIPQPFVLTPEQESIRRTGYDALADKTAYRPYKYQLKPRASTTSEVRAPKNLFSLPGAIVAEELFLYHTAPEEVFQTLPNHVPARRLYRLARNIEARNREADANAINLAQSPTPEPEYEDEVEDDVEWDNGVPGSGGDVGFDFYDEPPLPVPGPLPAATLFAASQATGSSLTTNLLNSEPPNGWQWPDSVPQPFATPEFDEETDNYTTPAPDHDTEATISPPTDLEPANEQNIAEEDTDYGTNQYDERILLCPEIKLEDLSEEARAALMEGERADALQRATEKENHSGVTYRLPELDGLFEEDKEDAEGKVGHDEEAIFEEIAWHEDAEEGQELNWDGLWSDA